MLNNDFFKGYVQALDNINSIVQNLYDQVIFNTDEKREAYKEVLLSIKQVRENYKQLVKDLNESQSKKTT